MIEKTTKSSAKQMEGFLDVANMSQLFATHIFDLLKVVGKENILSK